MGEGAGAAAAAEARDARCIQSQQDKSRYQEDSAVGPLTEELWAQRSVSDQQLKQDRVY